MPVEVWLAVFFDLEARGEEKEKEQRKKEEKKTSVCYMTPVACVRY